MFLSLSHLALPAGALFYIQPKEDHMVTIEGLKLTFYMIFVALPTFIIESLGDYISMLLSVPSL